MTTAFCPSCGASTDATPGRWVTCRACTATFQAPASLPQQPPPAAAPAPDVSRAPDIARPAPPTDGGWPTRSPLGGNVTSAGPSTNALAIVSLVLAIVCCVPLSGVGAIVTGVIARKQIETTGQQGDGLALAGIIIGALSVCLSVASVILSLVGR